MNKRDANEPDPFEGEDVQRIYCQNCGRFLCWHIILEGAVALPCKRCKKLTIFRVVRDVDTPAQTAIDSH